MGFTNYGLEAMLKIVFQNDSLPGGGGFNLMMVSDTASTLNATTELFSTLTECPNGNGYSVGGIAIPRSAVGFDVSANATTGGGLAYIELADYGWTATGGGPIPLGGGTMQSFVLTDDAPSPKVWGFWTNASPFSIPSLQTLTLSDFKLQHTQ